MTTAETIRSLRVRAGITQRELAERIGVTDKAVSKWESGRGLPDAGLMQQVAQGLGISVAELVEGVAVRRLYPEQACEVRFAYRSPGRIFALCSDHGLFSTSIAAKA